MELLLGRRKRSPVLLAVIFITFFHSVLSRHRIRHYKDRFKRQQGAHLYLPESFVTEGDEGREDAGPWLEWSEPSPCSRTCGGGVSTQYRQCQDGYICRGASRRHFSCNTQDCPDTGDFRAQQCSEYDEVAFENEKYQWIPYTKGPNPCELNCMPKGQRFYYRHAPQVIDGTRCTDDKLDVCVNGKCQPVGCNMMLGSNLTEDECRICGGDGSTCNTIRNTLDLNDLQMKQGYNDILLIPAGATNIAVEEVAPSNNYLAVRNTSGYYYLNGNWRIDFPRSIEFAGSKFHYERFPQEFAAPDKIYTLGPIDEPLFIVLLYQDTVVPVQYKYSLPTNVQPGDDHETYAWTFDEYTPCTATCGGGIQYRNVSCAGRRTLDPVDEILCDAGRKPETSRRCNEVACEAQWVPHPWGNCSVPCGEEGGIQTREVSCQQIVSNGYPSLVEETQCQGPKPPQQQTCNKGKTCASWHLGPWKPCDHLCGDGKQTRQVTCYIKDENGKIQILDDAQCEALEDKPAAEQDCFVRPCEGVDWITSEWSGCDNVCGLNNETRRVFCATAKGQIYGDELCDLNQKPETIRGCEKSENETCNFMWYASQWSECSAKCGVGIQTRTLFCGLSSSEGVKKVENEKCDQSKNFETIRNCTGNTECDGEWFSGPWTECSKACGGGERSKKVVCIKGNEVVDDSHCDPDAFIIPREDCNEQPCTKDSIMPLDKKTSAALEKEESEKPTTKMPPTTESVTETGGSETSVTGKESDGTESMSASDISELTKSFEFTTEPQSEESGKEGEENYEIVPADTCDDGEWVEVAVKEVLIDEASAVTETTIDFSEPSGSTTTPLEPDYSIYDTMMSDGTTMEDTAITGSGDGASSLSSTQEEGSGSEPSSIVTDDVEPSVSYISSSMVSGSTESETGSTTTEGISESPSTTIESSETSTEVSASSEATTITGTETGTTVTEETTDVSSTTETASSETVEGSTETPTTIESSTTIVTSESSESSTSDTTIDLSTVTETATSGSSETNESSSSDTTIDLSTVTETITSESSESTQTTESITSDTTTDMSTVTETSTSGSSETTESVTSDATTVNLSTITASTETIEGSESTTSEGTTKSTTSGSTIGSTEESGSTTEVGSTATDSSTVTSEGSTTEVISTSEGSTETGGSTETTQSFTESTTEVTSTTSGSSEESTTTESGTTGSEMSTTESTGSTMETMETGASESSTEFTGSTTEIDIFSTTPTETDLTTTLWPTTHVTEIFKKRQRMCKRRKIMQCQSSKYGCCWDNIHAAAGPFDKGCPTPKTCKESTYGCCADGVSAALGPKNRGCPSSHCNETLFGCCWDKKTPAEGNDDEGCPPKPPACVSSEWGCCKDNITEAKGPSQKGCEPDETTENEISTTEAITEPTTLSPEECKTTDYGCCPDGTPAKGPQYQGCNLPCASSTYGCCPDQQNPAHGYRGEGCCLNTPFGCCSDGVTAARGANGEGCDCQSSTYGCCPDRVTPAQGYNNEGCGCRYSQYKCCPDELTAASGPNFEGCPCHTFQFGCCPDGVTVAEGPQQQGCDCRLSEFGCCSDEVTAATGPEGAGCSCAQTKYGCCLDGVSEAKGDNFAGCEEIPVDRQGACSLPNIRGPCRNFTVKWFYDIKYGGCSRFWYGGCDGNENRFKTKEECEGVCVKPQGIERCNLPKVNGSCDGYFLKWYYDKEMRQCSQFAYSGCLGNDNKFDTREECAELCSKDVSADPCEQTKSEGPCRGQFRRFFFDKESGDCQEFIYGGCRGNSNNFVSREACKLKCATPGKKRDYCTLPKAEGNCTAREPRWHYGAHEQRCLPFYYTGCHGNKNNFNSKDACEENCPKEVAQDMCHLPAHIGECGNYVTRWYWDTRYKRCSQFYWGGCGGNANNFQTAEECERSCLRGEEEVPPPPTAPSTRAPVQEPQTERPTQAEPAPHTARVPTIEEICAMRPDRGPCTDDALHYYYDGVDGVCKNFTYGGCGGNYNNFENEEICLQYCGSVRALPPVYTTQAPLIIREPLPENSRCYEQFDPGNCTYQYELFYYDRNTDSCNKFIYSGCGGSGNQFYSEEDCLRQCGEFRGQDICNLDMDPGPCYGAFTKYYFDKNSGTCREFSYGGCKGNANRFSLVQECEAICGRRDEPKPSQQPAEVCQLPADQGSCADPNHKRWYFDNTQGECKAFIYSGCGGNYNNFKTFQACLDFCKDFLPHSESPIVDPGIVSSQKCQEKFEECSNLRCPYGVEAYVDENDCNGCRCRDPCRDVDCPENTKCGIDLNRNRTSQEDAEFVAVCREINKSGQCPAFSTNTNNDICDNECTTDADCTLHYKCCTSSCGFACLEPQKEVVEVPAPQPEYTTMSSVEIYSPPKIDVEIYEPEVSAMLGDQAILNCAVSGNPNPNIVWQKDNVIIDGTQPRYRIRLDQTLQIITIHKTDAGVYVCTADNKIGKPIRNEIRLEVVDPSADRAVSILNGQDPELLSNHIIASFNSPASLQCYALGWPLPAVTWWKNEELIPLKNREFEVTKDYALLIHSIQLHNLGVYTCQAYNGIGQAASWSVTVKAKGPYFSNNPADVKYMQYVVNPPGPPTVLPPPLPTVPPTTQNWERPTAFQRPTPQPYIPPVYSTEDPNSSVFDPNEIYPQFPDGGVPDSVVIVPVRANITSTETRYPTGSTVQIPCQVDGYPLPQVQWYKDEVPLYPNANERISESATHTLTIKSADKRDSGRYKCEATNQYSKATSSLDVSIEGMYIDPSCTDNQFFANCKLIVRANFCNHKYYAKFCCRSCTEAGQLRADNKQNALDTNLI
ncbi:papilin isoform X2 [Anthonomus grandis grandis]|uniref:papilin isoform X2 n=1 Tax=Anthonomus grandis grandis TaxID=2921223 RepID=UPI002165AB7F|nr:papilin isoform X2 [Anthonomus grandis grandis]